MTEPIASAPVDDITIETNGPLHEEPAPALTTAAVEATEDADAADPGDEDGQAVEDAPKPKKNSVQARIDKAIAAQRDAERRAEAAEQRAREYEAKQAAPRSEPPQERKEPQYTRPKPTESEIGTKYADYPAYVEDLTDWKLEQRDAQQSIQARLHAVRQRHESDAKRFSDRIGKAIAADPQIWNKIDPSIQALYPSSALDAQDPQLLDRARAAAMRGDPGAIEFLGKTEIADIIFDSDYAIELMTHFSANNAEFQRLSTLPPRQLVREMGRLEASFSRSAAASSGPAPKTLPVSQAPPPIKPVGTTASAGEVDPLSDDLDVDTHIRVMNAKERKAQRR